MATPPSPSLATSWPLPTSVTPVHTSSAAFSQQRPPLPDRRPPKPFSSLDCIHRRAWPNSFSATRSPKAAQHLSSPRPCELPRLRPSPIRPSFPSRPVRSQAKHALARRPRRVSRFTTPPTPPTRSSQLPMAVLAPPDPSTQTLAQSHHFLVRPHPLPSGLCAAHRARAQLYAVRCAPATSRLVSPAALRAPRNAHRFMPAPQIQTVHQIHARACVIPTTHMLVTTLACARRLTFMI